MAMPQNRRHPVRLGRSSEPASARQRLGDTKTEK